MHIDAFIEYIHTVYLKDSKSVLHAIALRSRLSAISFHIVKMTPAFGLTRKCTNPKPSDWNSTGPAVRKYKKGKASDHKASEDFRNYCIATFLTFNCVFGFWMGFPTFGGVLSNYQTTFHRSLVKHPACEKMQPCQSRGPAEWESERARERERERKKKQKRVRRQNIWEKNHQKNIEE